MDASKALQLSRGSVTISLSPEISSQIPVLCQGRVRVEGEPEDKNPGPSLYTPHASSTQIKDLTCHLRERFSTMEYEGQKSNTPSGMIRQHSSTA